MPVLVIWVRLYEGRYHGEGDWPPSPGRLFQALVAGAGLSGQLKAEDRKALEWLERLPAPIMAAPRARRADRGWSIFVPNNDADAVRGDPAQIAKVRTAVKVFRPYLFSADLPFLYAWRIGDSTEDLASASQICAMAEQLYQLGRGWDLAWAWGEILEDDELERLLSGYPGEVFRPTDGRGRRFRTPCSGTLESLERRHAAFRERFSYIKAEASTEVTFRLPPKARFQLLAYNGEGRRRVFELRDPVRGTDFVPWPLRRATDLVVTVRDAALERLRRVIPARAADIERALIGRRPDGSNHCPSERRVQIIPLPSIGHVHADRQIRRILVHTPPECLLAPADIEWAFSGLDLVDEKTGTVLATLVPSDDDSFARYFGAGGDGSTRLWRTVTAAALPVAPGFPRSGRAASRVTARERLAKMCDAASATLTALRHAGVRATVEEIRVQKEPFEGRGEPAQSFAREPRFHESSLWHVEVRFSKEVTGPIVIGNGRFLGLGIMAPARMAEEVLALQIEGGLPADAEGESVVKSLRRAVMALVGEEFDGNVPSFFSGHAEDGSPARSDREPHLAFSIDPSRDLLLVIAPSLLMRRPPTPREVEYLALLERKLGELRVLRAGRAGALSLSPAAIEAESDPLLKRARTWRTLTPYLVARHHRTGNAVEAVRVDVRTQLALHGLPGAEIEVERLWSTPRRGIEAVVWLRFARPIHGPILLGRNRFMGGGLFTGSGIQPVAVSF